VKDKKRIEVEVKGMIRKSKDMGVDKEEEEIYMEN
jgi:hypothetical protein